MKTMMIPIFCCRICGIPILPERLQTGTCGSPECSFLLADSRRPAHARRFSPEEYQAKVRVQRGELAGGYRGQAS